MIYAIVWKNNYMKTRNLFIGLGIAAGAAITIAALRGKNNKVKEFVNSKIKQVSGNKEGAGKTDNIDYV